MLSFVLSTCLLCVCCWKERFCPSWWAREKKAWDHRCFLWRLNVAFSHLHEHPWYLGQPPWYNLLGITLSLSSSKGFPHFLECCNKCLGGICSKSVSNTLTLVVMFWNGALAWTHANLKLCNHPCIFWSYSVITKLNWESLSSLFSFLQRKWVVCHGNSEKPIKKMLVIIQIMDMEIRASNVFCKSAGRKRNLGCIFWMYAC